MSTGRAASGGVSPGVPPLAVVSDEALVDLPGLPARLASMAAELRLIARNYPLHTLARAGVGDAIEQAQAIREMAHSLTALLAAQVEARDIASQSGLSRNDWVTAHAPTLAGGPGAAVTAVGAALAGGERQRWRPLGRMVRHGETTVDKAAIIVRFHNEVVRVADREQLDPIVDSLVEHSQVLGVKELRTLVAQARVALKPPKDLQAEEVRLRAGRVLTKIGRVAGLVEYRLRLDPEGAAILDAAIDPLARPPGRTWTGTRSGTWRLTRRVRARSGRAAGTAPTSRPGTRRPGTRRPGTGRPGTGRSGTRRTRAGTAAAARSPTRSRGGTRGPRRHAARMPCSS